MTANTLKARIARLEAQTSANRRFIDIDAPDAEDVDDILAAFGIVPTDKDMIVRDMRFDDLRAELGRPPNNEPAHVRIDGIEQ